MTPRTGRASPGSRIAAIRVPWENSACLTGRMPGHGSRGGPPPAEAGQADRPSRTRPAGTRSRSAAFWRSSDTASAATLAYSGDFQQVDEDECGDVVIAGTGGFDVEVATAPRSRTCRW
jgi:hypothetical protein